MDQTIYAVACNQGQVFTNPAIYYDHPVPAPPGNVMSISAVGGALTTRIGAGKRTA